MRKLNIILITAFLGILNTGLSQAEVLAGSPGAKARFAVQAQQLKHPTAAKKAWTGSAQAWVVHQHKGHPQRAKQVK